MISRSTINVIQLGIGMCLVFFAFISQRNFWKLVKLVKFSGICVYGGFIISNIIAPPLVKLFTPKWSLVIGSATYTLYMIGYLFLNSYYLYASATFEGLCAGLLWTAMGHYLALNSNEQNIGRNSALVWFLYMSSMVFGGIFLLVMFGSEDSEDISVSLQHTLYGTFSAVSFLGNVVFAFLPNVPEKHAEGEKQVQKSYVDELKKSLQLATTKDVMLLAIPFAFSGIELSYYSSVYSNALSFTRRFTINTNVLMALNQITIGCGELLTSLIYGVLGKRANRYGHYPIILLGSVAGIIAYIISYLNLPGEAAYQETTDASVIDPPSVAAALVAGLLLGISDACLNTQIYSIVTVMFEFETAQVFALHKFFHALLTTACMFYGSVLQLQWQLLILLITTIMSSGAFMMAEIPFIRANRIGEKGTKM